MLNLYQAYWRHAMDYLDITCTANVLYLRGNDFIKSGLDLFDVEWNNIQIAQKWVRSHLDVNARLAEVSCLYAQAGSNLLELRQYPHQRIQWLQTPVTATRMIQDLAAEGAALGNLGNAFAVWVNFVPR